MQVSSIASPQATPSKATTSQRPKEAVSSDFQTFLKMLTAQIKNQDPLNPMKSEDFAVQLATFSGVEQQVKTNDLLTSLGNQLGPSSLGSMAGWIGMEARTSAPVRFDGQPLHIFPDAEPTADKAILHVKDAGGKEVWTGQIDPGAASFVWAGTGPDGTPLANGTYSFEVESMRNGKTISTTAAQTYSRVQEAKLINAQPVLVLAGGAQVPAKDVTALREPAS